MLLIHHPASTQGIHHKRRKLLRWLIPSVLAPVAVPILVVQIAIARAGPVLKGKVVENPARTLRRSGTYRLDTRVVDLAGNVRTRAQVSEMVASK